MLTSTQIRQTFLDFFKKYNHTIVDSAPVFPYDDPTLLFTNAGMNQFKDVFLGKGTRSYVRAADTQKCIRVSGKHNDLEEVGVDTYHHTLFEMLGNWSFGDYFKQDAIKWAWELLVDVYKIPVDRIYVTVFEGSVDDKLPFDQEAFDVWKTVIAEDRILKGNKKDNFWEMGDTGPCGPCTEIHVDLRDDSERKLVDGKELVNQSNPHVIEIWNNVFIEFNRKSDGSLEKLPAQHVDTGMGFERLCMVIQGKKSTYDTDVFAPIMSKITELSGKEYVGENQIPIRVIADHIRSISFSIADGVIPSNDGRGYVIRRILRRAARYGRKLGLTQPFLYKIVGVLSETMGHVFPEMIKRKEHVERVIKSEEESFSAALDRGTQIFEEISQKLIAAGKKEFPGSDAFKLYDTYGFPLDLTRLMASEINLTTDEAGFNQLMEEQRDRARRAGKFTVNHDENSGSWEKISDGKNSQFKGYESLTSDFEVREVRKGPNFIEVVLDQTPFYGESGGQVGDNGYLEIDGVRYPVLDTQKVNEKIIHLVEAFPSISGKVTGKAVVNLTDRKNTARNHTATHLLHAALRLVLGDHVHQAGSLVAPDRLRFDFAHFEKITEEQLATIEKLVRAEINKSIDLNIKVTSFDQAQTEGAMALFGEKYGNEVRVITIGDFSKELCGGTHLHNTSEVGHFRIVSEGSVAAGVRRIEAVTGQSAEDLVEQERQLLKSITSILHQNKQQNLAHSIEELVETKKSLEKEVLKLRLAQSESLLEKFISTATTIDGVRLITGELSSISMDELKVVGNNLREKLKTSAVGILISVVDSKAVLVAVVTDDLAKSKKLSAGKLVGDIAKILDGNGGGQPHIATAGGKNIAKVQDALNQSSQIVKSYLSLN